MNAWPFVFAAYGLTLGASLMIAIVSYRAMRRAEAAADAIKRR